MAKKTQNSATQNLPAKNLVSESWTLRQAANWILLRDLNRARRADGGALKSGRYLSHYDSDLPKKRDGESDTEISDRVEAYLQKRRDAEDDERSRWPGAQAELIEALKNSIVVARSIENKSAAIAPDEWKDGPRTFFNSIDARVDSDKIMAKWKPNRPTRAVLIDWMISYLNQERAACPNKPPSPPEVHNACRSAFGAPDDPLCPTFEEVRAAWNDVPRDLRKKKGRPSTKIK